MKYQKAIEFTLGMIIVFLLMLLVFVSLLIAQLNAPMFLNAAMAEQTLHGRVIILDPGHGEGNTNIFQGYDEHVRMLALAHRIKPLLEARGAVVHMTRPTEEDVTLPARAAIINKLALEAVRDSRHKELELAESAQGARRIQREILEIDRLLRVLQSVIDDPETNAPIYFNYPFDRTHTRQIHPDLQKVFEYQHDPEIWEQFLVISLHSNATPRPINTARNGADSFFVSNNLSNNARYFANYANVQRNAYFADLIIRNIEPLGINRNKASAYYFFMIRENNLPCVLVENGFHTNPQDRAKLQDDDFLDSLAVVYADTILDYFTNLDLIPEYSPGMFGDVFGQL